MAVAVPSQIQANLVRQYWDTKLQYESLHRDIFSQLRTVFDRTSGIDIPKGSLVLEINAEAENGYRSATIGFQRALNQAPRRGDLQLQIGFEERKRQLSQTVYYNEFSHAVSDYNYGIHFSSGTQPYNVNMDQTTKLLGDYFEELFGLHYRQALLQRRSDVVTFSPVFQAQAWNPRFYVKNVSDALQPAYDTTLQNHTNNIAQSLISAGTGEAATLDARYLTALRTYCINNRIEMLDLGSGRGKGWVLTVPTNQVFHIHDLDKTGGVAPYWTSVARMNEMQTANFPNLLGKWLDIWLVEDDRAPTLTVGGSASPFTLTPGYVWPGNNDQRDTSLGARDVGFLLGRAPIVDMYPVKLHHKYDDYNYQKWEGKGGFCERGINMRMYDAATPTNTSWEQRYCVACVWARDTISN